MADKKRYEVRDGKIFDNGFDTTLSQDIVCNMLNQLYEKYGAKNEPVEEED